VDQGDVVACLDQTVPYYVGMWKTRFAKEDKKAEKKRVEVDEAKVKAGEAILKAEEMVKANREKLLGRLKVLNRSLGLVDEAATVT
jgi:membrane-associated HD superfamily phosphohydrolase